MSIFVRSTVLLLLLVFSTAIGKAQGFNPSARPAPLGRAIGMNEQIKGILQDMLATYRDAKSYEDTARVAVRRTNGRVRETTEMPSRVSFRRPNLIQLIGGGQTISSDGDSLQIVLDGLGQYTSTAVPAKLEMRHVEMGAPGAGLDEGYPEVLEFLVGADIYNRWIRRIQSIVLDDKSTTIGGEPCDVIHYESVYRAKVSMFISQESNLLLLCNMDLTRAQQSPNAPPSPNQGKLEIQYQLAPARVNHEIDQATFAVKVPLGMRLVKRFQADSLNPDNPSPQGFAPEVDEHEFRSALLNQNAPAIETQDLDGNAIASKQLLGKVTLLCFWSPAGGADSLAAVQMVQRIVDKHANSAFGALSVTGAADKPENIKDLLRLKKAKYPTVVDTDSRLLTAFQVEDVPTFFVISPDGIIRHASAGSPSEREQEISQSVALELAKLEKKSKP